MHRAGAKYGYYLRSIATLLLRFRTPLLIVRIFTGTASKGVKTVRVRTSDLRFDVRGAMDVWSVKEAVVDRFYERCGFSVHPGWTVVDIGAAIGEFAIHVAAMDSRNRVLAFEPFPESFALFQRNVEQNGLANLRIFSEAVSAASGTLVLDLASGEPLRFESRQGVMGESSQQITVASIALSEIVTRTDAGRIDLLKLDCEGAEYDILLNSSPVTLGQIDRIVLEYHENLTPHTHGELVTFLETNGYSVEVFPNVAHPAEIGYLRARR